MDHNENNLPFEEPIPEEMLPLEETPVIEELVFQPETSEPVTEEALPEDIPEGAPYVGAFEAPEPEVLPEEIPEEAESAWPEEICFPEESLTEQPEEAPFPEESQPEEIPSFMERIPEVEEEEEEEAPQWEELPEEAPEEESDPVLEALLAEEAAREEAYQGHSQDFQEMFEAPAEPPKPEPKRHPPRKGRPKRKKGEGLFGIPNILATFVWLALILAIGVTAGRMLWVCAADVLAFGREDKPVTVTIYAGDDMATITDKLYDAGLIRYKSLFSLYASISDAEEDIKPGIYDLNTLYDYHALVNFMSPRSSREVIQLTIPEGYTCRQIFALLEENRVCTALDAANYAATGELDDYWFLEGVERGSEYCLEGYLFPDTYEFYKNSTPREALERMLNNFDNRFSEEMRAQIETLNANVTGGGYTIREVTIVASLIEKESAAAEESSDIAGVIYNRLFRWEGVPAYLNIDASIVYAQGGDAETIDTGLDSPYNTYTHIGLTPGPISNPGLSSLKAALNPSNHDYYYYVLNPATGRHQFSSTQAEHDSWIQKFYNS